MFTVELNAEAMTAALTRASEQLGDMTPLFTDIGEILIYSTKRRFGTGRSPGRQQVEGQVPDHAESLWCAQIQPDRCAPSLWPIWDAVIAGILGACSGPGRDRIEPHLCRDDAIRRHQGRVPASVGRYTLPPVFGVSAEDEVNITVQIADYLSGALQP